MNRLMEDNNKLYEILTSDDVVKCINDNMDLLLKYIPELRFMMGFEQNHPHHHLDVWNHTLYALSLSENNFDIRLALLLHDIGKPFSYQDDEVRHFHSHPNVSHYIARLVLNRLKFDKEYINYICYLIKKHDTPITEEDIKKNYDIEYKRYKVQECDALAHHPDKLAKRKKYLNNTKKLIKDYRK